MKEFSVDVFDLVMEHELSPVEILWFYLDGEDTPTHRYVRANRRVAFDGSMHEPLGFSRGAVDSSSGEAIDKIAVQVDNVNLEFSQFVLRRPFDGSRIGIHRIFRENWADTSNKVTIFDGRVQEISFDGRTMTTEVVSHLSFLSRPTPARLYNSGCNHRLGNARCGVDLALPEFRFTGVLGQSGSSDRILFNSQLAQVDNYWAFGYVRIEDGDYKGLWRPVASSSYEDRSIYFRYPFPVSLEGQTCTILIGCQKTKPFCRKTFGNLINYGGFAETPRRPIIPVAK